MSIKKIVTITLLVVTNFIAGIAVVVFFFGMTKSGLSNEETHSRWHVQLKKRKFEEYILHVNKGLNIKQFRSKHGIKYHDENKKVAKYRNIIFSFMNGVLTDIE